MIINNANFVKNLQKTSGVSQQNSTRKSQSTENNKLDFSNILNSKIEETKKLTFSKHASQRLEARNINLTHEQNERVLNAVNKAKEKGVKDSLIMVDDIALVVSITNRTVITALNRDELKDNVFTNIDGAVIT